MGHLTPIPAYNPKPLSFLKLGELFRVFDNSAFPYVYMLIQPFSDSSNSLTCVNIYSGITSNLQYTTLIIPCSGEIKITED